VVGAEGERRDLVPGGGVNPWVGALSVCATRGGRAGYSGGKAGGRVYLKLPLCGWVTDMWVRTHMSVKPNYQRESLPSAGCFSGPDRSWTHGTAPQLFFRATPSFL
jgi:hypothetical protein